MKTTKMMLGVACAMLSFAALAEEREITAVERITGLPPAAAGDTTGPSPVGEGAEISAFERITGLPDATEAATPREPGASNLVKGLDLVFARPFGAVATVIGAGAFVVLVGPAALAEGHFPDDVAKGTVQRPFDYTFRRPLGDTNSN